jgi:uncharacterized phage protein (TIGR02218 family)
VKSTVAPYQSSATCVRIECVNGTVVRLTDYPFDLTMANGSVYKTDYGYSPTALSASTSFSPSAIDLEGVAAVGGVTRDALASGVFDNARVFIFRCNYFAPVEDYEPMASGFFGKTTLIDDRYRIEGMSLIDALSQSVGSLYTASCQRIYGSAACGISLAAVTVTGTLTTVTNSRVFRDSARGESADWFGAGTIAFTSGPNVGLKPLEIKSYAADGTITTFDPVYYAPSIGDAYSMIKGCRRREADCIAQSNIVNFFGFTRIPAGSTYAQIGGQ